MNKNRYAVLLFVLCNLGSSFGDGRRTNSWAFYAGDGPFILNSTGSVYCVMGEFALWSKYDKGWQLPMSFDILPRDVFIADDGLTIAFLDYGKADNLWLIGVCRNGGNVWQYTIEDVLNCVGDSRSFFALSRSEAVGFFWDRPEGQVLALWFEALRKWVLVPIDGTGLVSPDMDTSIAASKILFSRLVLRYIASSPDALNRSSDAMLTRVTNDANKMRYHRSAKSKTLASFLSWFVINGEIGLDFVHPDFCATEYESEYEQEHSASNNAQSLGKSNAINDNSAVYGMGTNDAPNNAKEGQESSSKNQESD